ncbi:MAG: hypothetical protein JWQ56_2210 [Pseudarthrobacter sp.]|nr:hypothetical protein [Pseudarthrobacter sp.]
MNELSPPDESAAAQPSPEWPLNGKHEVTDHMVHQALAPLDGLPGTPVADHEEVYNELHDNLRAALDTDAASTPPSSSAPSDGGA